MTTLCQNVYVYNVNNAFFNNIACFLLHLPFKALNQRWAIYGPRAGSGPPQHFIWPTCACRNHDYSLYGYKFPLKISMKINKSSAKINIVIFHILSAPSIMCKTSHIYLKLTHQNFLCHSETLASLPRLAPSISAFRPANYVFWRATFKDIFSCRHARCSTRSFLLSGTSISKSKFNFSICTSVIYQSSNVIYCFSCSKCLMLYISETGRQAID